MKNQIQLMVMMFISINLWMLSTSSFSEEVQHQPLGTLFTDPQLRQQLELNRKNPSIKNTTFQKQTHSSNSSEVVQKNVKALPAPITMQGYVKRSDGPNTVWINHKPTEENVSVDDVNIGRLSARTSKKNNSLLNSQQRLQKTDQLSIKIPANGKVIQLKAGQRYEPVNNQIKEITTLARENKLQLEESRSFLEHFDQ